MRNYWLRIFLGALAVFTIGMVGVNVARRGVATVHTVLESDDPLTIPLRFVPFALSGERLGNLKRVVVFRDSPRRISAVELEVDLADSLLAEGLRGCRLAANFESDSRKPGLDIQVSRRNDNAFSCLTGDSIPAELVEFGEAVFQPGQVRVPLYLQRELVTELHQALAAHPASPEAESQTDALAALAELKSDSAVEAAARSADSAGKAGRWLGDSLRAAARQQADSARAVLRRLADTAPPR